MAKDNAVQSIREYATSGGLTPKVDRERGVITGVKILGLASRNGRVYESGGVAKAVPLYEGAKVNVNHSPQPGGPRDYRDRIGTFKGVRAEQDGLYGDFAFNPKHALAEQLCWDAEHSPGNVGFSHVVEAKCRRAKDGQTVVEEIQRVISVDLVADPATTRGLYEHEDAILEDQPELVELAEATLSAVDNVRSILFAKGEAKDIKRGRLAEALATWLAELNASAKPKPEGSDVELKDLTIEQLQKDRPDLVEQLQGNDAVSKLKAEAATLKEQLDALKAKDAESAKAKAIAEELKAAGLNADDKKIVSEAFTAQLKAAADAAGRKVLIEDRKALLGTQTVTRPAGDAPPMAPIAEHASAEPANGTLHETMRRWQ